MRKELRTAARAFCALAALGTALGGCRAFGYYDDVRTAKPFRPGIAYDAARHRQEMEFLREMSRDKRR